MLRKAIDRGAARPDVAKKLIDTALKNVRIDEALTVNNLLTVASRLRSFDPSEVRTYRMDGKGTNIGGASVIVPNLQDQATKDVLRLFRGEATLADAPPGSDQATASTDTTAATTTSTTIATTLTDGNSGGRTTVPATVTVEDNGVGIFPPDDPTCR
jgi:hypothetical protein